MAKTSYDVPAVRKALRLIELLCEKEEPLGVSEIGQLLGLNKNMTFRLLRTLWKEGWVVQEEGPKYRMGLRPFHHTSKPVSRMSVRAAAAGPLRELWEQTGESAYLTVLDDDRLLVVDHFDSTRDVRIAAKVGARYELHCAAPGKVLLAHAGESLLARLAEAGFARLTSHTITAPAELREHLAEVLARGYALDLEEYADGLICFAAPVFDYWERAVGAIGVSVLTLHYTPRQMIDVLGPKVVAAGKRISAALGCPEETGVLVCQG
jgi:IclR family acetate operon transcriptional repressor